MRWLFAGLAALAIASSTQAAPLRPSDLLTTQTVLHWISLYREAPDPSAVPDVMIRLSKLGALHDTEHCGVYAGFLAGVLAANPAQAETLVARSLVMAPDDRWIVVRAIADSGLPNWKELLRHVGGRIARQEMIDRYIAGRLPTLAQFTIPPDASMLDRMRDGLRLDKVFGAPNKPVTLAPSADVLDMLWGYYFATGSYGPVMHLVALLAWSSDHDDADRLAIGSMAKYTLATNAVHDAGLLAMLKQSQTARGQPKEIATPLKEVVEAAETVDTGPIRQQALTAINEVRSKGPQYKRTVSWWSYIGQTAIAGGCLAAASAGQVEFGIPCVVGGATSSAVMNFIANSP
jgi:hypothetical protein